MINSNHDPKAIHSNKSAEINGLTEKTTPVSADLLIIEDSAATNAKKKVQIGNLPSGGGSDPWTYYVLTSTFTVSNNTQTLITDGSTSWSHSVDANKWYEIDIHLFVIDGDGASDSRFEITKPASSDGHWYGDTAENAVSQTKSFTATGTLFFSFGGNGKPLIVQGTVEEKCILIHELIEAFEALLDQRTQRLDIVIGKNFVANEVNETGFIQFGEVLLIEPV